MLTYMVRSVDTGMTFVLDQIFKCYCYIVLCIHEWLGFRFLFYTPFYKSHICKDRMRFFPNESIDLFVLLNLTKIFLKDRTEFQYKGLLSRMCCCTGKSCRHSQNELFDKQSHIRYLHETQAYLSAVITHAANRGPDLSKAHEQIASLSFITSPSLDQTFS